MVLVHADAVEAEARRVLEFVESTFVPDGSGLWRNPSADVVDAAALDAGEGAPDLPARPVPVDERDEEDERFGSSHLVVAEGDGWEIVWTVSYDPEGLYTGMSFGNPIAKFTGDELTLDSDDGTKRVYSSVAAMP